METNFDIVDTCGGSSLCSDTVSGGVGDFSDFDPSTAGPYRISLGKNGTSVHSNEFLIDDHLTELTSYRDAIEFFTGSRMKYGDFGQLWDDPDNWDVSNDGFAWRDQPEFAFVIRSLVNLYRSNPAALENILVDSSDLPPDPDSGAYDYDNMPTSVPSDTPEVVRLIWWGAEVYYKANVDYTIQKNDLAAYPELDDWIPSDTYTRCRDLLFNVWTKATGTYQNVPKRYYTNHSRDLFTTFDQVGTSKGEFPPGFSIAGNLDMYQVAVREERSDADQYLRAARDQVDQIVNNLDETMPITTKGQRPNEFITVSNVVRFLREHPDEAPAGTVNWLKRWANEIVSRSNNMWDFRKWDSDTWVDEQLPEFPSDRINEPGNVAGFPAPALATANVLDDVDSSLAADLRRIAHSHVDNTFGRNPTGRHFCHRATESGYTWDGADRGWYSEYCGTIGELCGVRGVLNGSPKNDHYPDNPGVGDVGHTEGWTTFNAAFNQSLAWLSFDDSALEIQDTNGNEVSTVGTSDTITTALRIARDNETTGTNETVNVRMRMGDDAWETVTLTQTTSTGPWYEADVDLGSQGASSGDEIEVRYGHGAFTRTATATAGTSEAVVVDSEDILQVDVTGSWTTSTSDPDYVGDDYRHDNDVGKGSKQDLGLGDCEMQADEGASRHWHLLMAAYSLFVLIPIRTLWGRFVRNRHRFERTSNTP